MDRIRVVFMGSADLSAVMLERLARETETIQLVGCVTQPDKPAGRNKKLTPCACKAFVDQMGIPCLTPKKVNTEESLAQIAAWLPDVIVVVAYGQILSRRLLDIPTLGCINIHLSLLPRYRGASPIHAALLAGDKVTGASAMLMDEGMDTGPVLMSSETEITEADTLETLHDRLADLGADLLVKVLPLWAYFRVRPVPQNPDQVITAYKIKKTDGLLHWTDSTETILRKIRAYTPWPSCFTYCPPDEKDKKKNPELTIGKMVKVLSATAATVKAGAADVVPGTVLKADRDGLIVRTADGALQLLTVQPEGGKPMDVQAWLRGHTAIVPGFVFITPPPPPAAPIAAYRRL
ncbi:MAG: methionyl-tRNA formyltransferase [Kiritimatiellae bacterium]|nr:methionyl-tRNA formyltransferase [Kiritimatiellia bacterium]